MSIGRGVTPFAALERAELFEGLERADLIAAAMLMRPRSFDTGAELCRAGQVGESLLVIVDGLVHVVGPAGGTGSAHVVAKQRRGDAVGAMSLVTGEPHSATVVASMPTETLELGKADFDGLVERFPRILLNLTRVLSRRLARSAARAGHEASRGEAVALIVGPGLAPSLPDVLAATEAASARPVASLDTRTGFDAAVAQLDDLLAGHGTVIVVSRAEGRTAPLLLDHVDRAVILVDDEREAQRFADAAGDSMPDAGGTAGVQRIEVVLVEPDAPRLQRGRTIGSLPVVRALADRGERRFGTEDLAWLGRHLAGTKLGLALGAGGAKGYAHIGVLQVLEGAGYTVDCVAGSSIGAIVGAFLALGMGSAQIDATLRGAFTPETVAEVFKLSLAGGSTGLDRITAIFKQTTAERTFADVEIPLTLMSVDLAGREPAPIREGPLWEGLLAATALAGMFPPYERDGQRLVDGLALIPVPTGSVLDDGADLTISVNLVSDDTLAAWPGEEPPPPAAPKRRGSRMLDTLLEVMDLMQLDTSVRHADLADIVLTPRFGPGSWRDFHLADLFLQAGREAAEQALPALRALARPA